MSKILKKDFVYNQLREAIRSGVISANERLPGELELAKKYEVSRVTLRDALRKLEQDKLIIKINGKGTFVAENTSGKRFLAILPGGAVDISNPMQYIIPGIEKQLAKSGIELSTCSKEFMRNIDSRKAKLLFKEQAISGVFLMESNFIGNEPEINILETSGLPVILPHAYHSDRPLINFAIMLSDNRLAWGDGIRQLARQGHKRIGTIFGGNNSVSRIKYRDFTSKEYMEFLELNNLEAFPGLLKTSAPSYKNIFETVKEFMLGPKPPTAIMCYSDFYAIHVYAALEKLRIQIPEQVSVMGFCGYPGGEFMYPPLSTVDLMYENIGKMAADLMLKSDEWYGKDKPVTIFTPHRLKIRKSIQNPVMEYAIA
jgi:GntR family transcriptional regulator, arabinose operon transcriptional repressor